MNTKERRLAIMNVLNHCMDMRAREVEPDLSEEQRFEKALKILGDNGITDIKEADIFAALHHAEKAHNTRTVKPARTGVLLTGEGALNANHVVQNILDMFLRRNG